MEGTIHERSAHPLILTLMYWFVVVSLIVIGVTYSISFSEKNSPRPVTGDALETLPPR